MQELKERRDRAWRVVCGDSAGGKNSWGALSLTPIPHSAAHPRQSFHATHQRSFASVGESNLHPTSRIKIDA